MRATQRDGAPAPSFTTQATLGGKEFTFSLADALKRGPVVLYFYPKDGTSGCTIEAHMFADAMEDFEKLGATVIGVSRGALLWGPLVILAVALFPVRLGIAYALQPMLHADAIWWSFPAGTLASMAMTIAYYRYGNWRKGRLMPAAHCEEQAKAEVEPAARQMPLG